MGKSWKDRGYPVHTGEYGIYMGTPPERKKTMQVMDSETLDKVALVGTTAAVAGGILYAVYKILCQDK